MTNQKRLKEMIDIGTEAVRLFREHLSKDEVCRWIKDLNIWLEPSMSHTDFESVTVGVVITGTYNINFGKIVIPVELNICQRCHSDWPSYIVNSTRVLLETFKNSTEADDKCMEWLKVQRPSATVGELTLMNDDLLDGLQFRYYLTNSDDSCVVNESKVHDILESLFEAKIGISPY